MSGRCLHRCLSSNDNFPEFVPAVLILCRRTSRSIPPNISSEHPFVSLIETFFFFCPPAARTGRMILRVPTLERCLGRKVGCSKHLQDGSDILVRLPHQAALFQRWLVETQLARDKHAEYRVPGRQDSPAQFEDVNEVTVPTRPGAPLRSVASP